MASEPHTAIPSALDPSVVRACCVHFHARQRRVVDLALGGFLASVLLLSGVAQAETFSSWRAAKFSNAQLADPAISGEQADPDADGLANLLEYGAGLDPLLNQNFLPVQVELSAQGALSLSLREVPALSDLNYLFESTADLRYWITHNTVTETSRISLGDGVFQVALELPPDPAATNRRFARLRMVLQPTDLLFPPAQVTAQLLFPGGALVRWSDRSPIESGFLVERRAVSGATFATVGSVLPDTITFTDAAVQWSDDWVYRVTALDGNTGATSAEAQLVKPTDSDGDGIPDQWETQTFFTNPSLTDSDSDGMPDGWEVRNGFDPRVNDAGGDFDGDGLTNGQEFAAGTNPRLYSTGANETPDGFWLANSLSPLTASTTDTDGDGRSDVQEFLDGTNPNTSDDASGGEPPLAPTNVVLQTTTPTEHRLTWTNNETTTRLITIERADNGNNWKRIGHVGTNTATFSDRSATATTIYYYRLAIYR